MLGDVCPRYFFVRSHHGQPLVGGADRAGQLGLGEGRASGHISLPRVSCVTPPRQPKKPSAPFQRSDARLKRFHPVEKGEDR